MRPSAVASLLPQPVRPVPGTSSRLSGSRSGQSRFIQMDEPVVPFGDGFPYPPRRASSRFLTASTPCSARGLQVCCALLPTMGSIAFRARCAEALTVASSCFPLCAPSPRCSHPPKTFPRRQPATRHRALLPSRRCRPRRETRSVDLRALLHRRVRCAPLPLPASTRPILSWAFWGFSTTRGQ